MFLRCNVYSGDLSPIATDGDQAVRGSPLHTPGETSIQAATEASRVAPSLRQNKKNPEPVSVHGEGARNTGAGQQDSSDKRAEHRPPEAPLEQIKLTGSEETPEVVVEIEYETEPQTKKGTLAESAAEDLGDRIKREASRAADKAVKDTGGGKRIFLHII